MARSQRLVKSLAAQDDFFSTMPLPVVELGRSEKLACLRLIQTENIGPATFRTLINTYGGAHAALEAIPGIAYRGGRRTPIRICSQERAEQELHSAEAIGAKALFKIKPGYPKALAAIKYPPPLIYYQGQCHLLNRPAIAMVGSRNCSAAGAALARLLASDLGANRIVVVSCLARGIDGVTHNATLATGTVAVLAGGLDNYYPPEHRELQQKIADVGCLVTENPPGFQPRGEDFPRRNRLISGLSLGTVVIEAAIRSGSLTTARFAAEQSRDVFAVPGHPLDPRSEGTNKLLKSGAILTTNVTDIIAETAPQIDKPETADQELGEVEHQQKTWSATAAEQKFDIGDIERNTITDLLGPAPVSIDEVCRLSRLTVGQVKIVLLELSLAGRLQHHGQSLISLVEACEA